MNPQLRTIGKRVAIDPVAMHRRRRKKPRMYRSSLCIVAVSALAVSLATARPALAQSNANEQTLAPMQLTAPASTATLPVTSVYGARVEPVHGVEPETSPIFPRLRFGIGWEGTMVGGGYLVAGGPFGARIDVGARINRWIGFYTRLSGATLFVSHVAHAAAMVEFHPHRMISVSTGIGYVTYAYTPLCLFGGCGGPRSNEGITMPVRLTFLAHRSSDDHPRGGFSVGAEIFPGYAVGENGGPIVGGSLFFGYSRM